MLPELEADSRYLEPRLGAGPMPTCPATLAHEIAIWGSIR